MKSIQLLIYIIISAINTVHWLAMRLDRLAESVETGLSWFFSLMPTSKLYLLIALLIGQQLNNLSLNLNCLFTA